ncbi:hydantoinase B/oxoprolinase family protein [Neobacillus niacini]|uniref:hydantoinase B/oxoprolinase family protein n=1 Tax=Neobacillus niacini TaxID=86668 RepID=UPI0021CB99C2|nr:hydantoinase B/oxoprolinase family protein [Neobacillus niacini]MCM3766218.1 hydantoinase B/oxoprolinase family protein [Neobacillus niacini]
MTQTNREQELVEKFLQDNAYFRGPDREIIENHGLEPITDREKKAIANTSDEKMSIIRSRIQAVATEATEMIMQLGSAPGAKWGDLTASFYTASGDMTLGSTKGITAFATSSQYALKYTIKYWGKDPNVGIRPGDAFMHNDARYGGVHNADQSVFIPIFHKGELVAWGCCIIHEGENGAVEPGGMPVIAESKFMEGLAISPIKIAEKYNLRNDIVTFLQNSTREPKLMLQDIKTKLSACIRMQKRMEEIIEEFGVDAVIATLRKTLDDTDQEVRRRISEWQDGTVRTFFVLDNTGRENIMIKVNLEVEKKGDTLSIDFSGSSPEFLNRAVNVNLSVMHGMIAVGFLYYVWPDLPRNQAVINSFKIKAHSKSVVNGSDDVPVALAISIAESMVSVLQQIFGKFLYSAERRYTRIISPVYSSVDGFGYGGVTQHGEIVGNISADINGMPSGAREDMDGEHSIYLTSAAMADQGEQELFEEELPWIHLSRRIFKDNQGFGKYRGGSGFQQIVSVKGSPFWGLQSVTPASRVPMVSGLFGGYGCPVYPLARVKGVNVFKIMQEHPELFEYSIDEIMNTKPFEGGTYNTRQKGMAFEQMQEGELYMQTQGAGGGYGDVLDRDPNMVIKDLEDQIISDYVSQNIYHVVYDPETLVIDVEATIKKRQQEREARKKRGVPYQEFIERWVTERPPGHLPWYGSWGNNKNVYAGSPDNVMQVDHLQPVTLPDPKDVRIAELERLLAERN